MNRHFFPGLTGYRDYFAESEGCFAFDPFIVLHHTWSWENWSLIKIAQFFAPSRGMQILPFRMWGSEFANYNPDPGYGELSLRKKMWELKL
jgi:hypothetical protein